MVFDILFAVPYFVPFSFSYYVNQQTGSALATQGNVQEFGSVFSPLTLCSAVVWALVFLVLVRGPKTYGKCAYALAILPWLLVLALLISGVLSGKQDFGQGILDLLSPDWEKLLYIQVALLLYPLFQFYM